MFDLNPLLSGRPHTTMAALHAVAFVFSPAVFFVSPRGYVSVCLAIACSALSTMLAWMTWTKSSRSLAIAASVRMRIIAIPKAAVIGVTQLDLQEAPQRLMEMQKEQDDEERLALERARLLNKPNFRL